MVRVDLAKHDGRSFTACRRDHFLRNISPPLTRQRVQLSLLTLPLKTLAMRAWSEPVLNAYLKAGGVWSPRPYEDSIKKYARSKGISRKLGVDITRICIQNVAPLRNKTTNSYVICNGNFAYLVYSLGLWELSQFRSVCPIGNMIPINGNDLSTPSSLCASSSECLQDHKNQGDGDRAADARCDLGKGHELHPVRRG